MSPSAWIVLGFVAGFIASRIVSRTGLGVVMNILLGIGGAVLSAKGRSCPERNDRCRGAHPLAGVGSRTHLPGAVRADRGRAPPHRAGRPVRPEGRRQPGPAGFGPARRTRGGEYSRTEVQVPELPEDLAMIVKMMGLAPRHPQAAAGNRPQGSKATSSTDP